jgi:uncharacterized protein
LTTGNTSFHFKFLEHNFHLLPQKAIFWENENILLIADTHLGKVEHFRKAGIAIPGMLARKDYQVLDQLLDLYAVRTVIILGDLFHSIHNQAWEVFSGWLMQYPATEFILVKGNHDILPDQYYQLNHIEIHHDYLIKHPFIFSHVPIKDQNKLYNLAGHVHPAVKLTGKGKQSLVLPCFYFGKYNGILPAFGNFTGKGTILTEAGDNIFIVFDNQVIPLAE